MKHRITLQVSFDWDTIPSTMEKRYWLRNLREWANGSANVTAKVVKLIPKNKKRRN